MASSIAQATNATAKSGTKHTHAYAVVPIENLEHAAFNNENRERGLSDWLSYANRTLRLGFEAGVREIQTLISENAALQSESRKCWLNVLLNHTSRTL